MATTANFLNSNITRITLLCGDVEIGLGTGFFYRWQNQWFLISNWHVFAAREPATGQPKDPSFAVPNRCRYHTPRLTEKALVWDAHHVDLEDVSGTPTWFEHPIHGQNCDIGAVPLSSKLVGPAKDFEDSGGCDHDMFIDLGQDLFLPGFPLGFASNGLMPIWKRASLASSLEFGHGISDYFYVDTATRQGMSGSPCIAISNWRHYSMDRSTGNVRVVDRPLSWRLMGVYSGRRNPSDGFEAQIGIVWHYRRMIEVVAGRKCCNVVLKST